MKDVSTPLSKDQIIQRLKDIERDLSYGLNIHLHDSRLWEVYVGVIQPGALYNQELKRALDNMEGTA